MTFLPFVSSTSSRPTVAPLRSGLPTENLSPLPTRSTSEMVIFFAPSAGKSTNSMSRVSPSVTLYCFPPERITANMNSSFNLASGPSCPMRAEAQAFFTRYRRYDLRLEFDREHFDAARIMMRGPARLAFQVVTAAGSGEIFLTNAIRGRSRGRNQDGAVFRAIDKDTAELGLEHSVGIRKTFGVERTGSIV